MSVRRELTRVAKRVSVVRAAEVKCCINETKIYSDRDNLDRFVLWFSKEKRSKFIPVTVVLL